VNVRRTQIEQFIENAAIFGFGTHVSPSGSRGERGGNADSVWKGVPVTVSGVVTRDETGATMGGRV
jgi:hypothetical protein